MMRDVQPDTIIDGRYKIETRVGSGGMADVYCAIDQQLGRKVALKLLYRRFAEDPEFVERFRREARAAAGLQHQNVVSVYDSGEWDGTYYIAMEFLDGSSLKDIVRHEGSLDPDYAIDLTIQILRAARFAHKRGIIHRDLKPHNVIVDADGRAKVTDFGIARAGASDMTETGSIMGTAQYLSPEQAQGRAVSAQSDIYSIGILLYELLTGEVPFQAESAVTIALKHVSALPTPPATINPAVSLQLQAVVMQALAKDPAARFADGDAMIEALEAVRDGTAPVPPRNGRRRGGAVPPPDGTGIWTGEYAQVEQRRRWPGWLRALLWLALLLAAVAIALGAYLALRPDPVTVPNVVGVREETAAARLANAGLDSRTREVVSSTVPAGRVARQDPQPGTELDQGDVVTLTVSTGPGTASVPAVRGQSRARAERALEDAGFKVRVREEPSEDVDKGRVIETNPAAGQAIEKGTTVLLIVSGGAEQVELPTLTGRSLDAAERQLIDLGLDLGAVTQRETEDREADTVLEQSPAPGTMLDKGSAVNLTVAKAPQESEVPDVLGKGRNTAVRELRAAGFDPEVQEIEIENSDEDGRVVTQRPDPGDKRRRGATVVIQVGKFVPPEDIGDDSTPTPTPTVTPSPTPTP